MISPEALERFNRAFAGDEFARSKLTPEEIAILDVGDLSYTSTGAEIIDPQYQTVSDKYQRYWDSIYNAGSE